MNLNKQQMLDFEQNGYVIVPSLFNEEEMKALNEYSRHQMGLLGEEGHATIDSEGKKSKICLWDHPEDNLFGHFSRSERLVNNAQALLDGDEIYHWHSKVMIKEPKVGGAWEWHQDYGYWYSGNCLFPDLISCMVAIDKATVENGCLQVLKGSHKLGRIDHIQIGTQTGADPERVAEAEKVLEKIHVELNPGDTLFFHSNLLHCSSPNTSENPRWCLISCYNKRSNSPYGPEGRHGHCKYTPLTTVPDQAIMAKAKEELASL
jgi:ectoine hydroxylase-related dioxygenase (phytanoyl-CoA dioxygenase family)